MKSRDRKLEMRPGTSSLGDRTSTTEEEGTSDLLIEILACFTDGGFGIEVVVSFVAAMVEIVVVASLVAAVFVFAVGKLRGPIGAVVVVTCAASSGGFAVLAVSELLSVREGVVSEVDCARPKTHSEFRGVRVGLELREVSYLT